jgi:hypothetical protein
MSWRRSAYSPQPATSGHRDEQDRGLAYAILDGTLIPIDRVADQKPYYSGKHRRYGMNVQVIADASGRLVRASAALPGSTHDLTGAHAHGIIDALSSDDVMTFAEGSQRRSWQRPDTVQASDLEILALRA